MSLVNSNLDYHKVVLMAPMALRMAIVIGRHDKYSIAQLLDALCQRTCIECGTLTHYVCPLTYQRLCLSQNGFCGGKLGPWKLVRQDGDEWEGHADDSGDFEWDSDNPESRLSFKPIPGLYKLDWPLVDPSMALSRRVKPGDVYFLEQSIKFDGSIALCQARTELVMHLILNKSLSVVVAPWLSKTSLVGVYGTRCLVCKAEDEKEDRERAKHPDTWRDCILQRRCEIWTEEGLVKHMQEAHK